MSMDANKGSFNAFRLAKFKRVLIWITLVVLLVPAVSRAIAIGSIEVESVILLKLWVAVLMFSFAILVVIEGLGEIRENRAQNERLVPILNIGVYTVAVLFCASLVYMYLALLVGKSPVGAASIAGTAAAVLARFFVFLGYVSILAVALACFKIARTSLRRRRAVFGYVIGVISILALLLLFLLMYSDLTSS